MLAPTYYPLQKYKHREPMAILRLTIGTHNPATPDYYITTTAHSCSTKHLQPIASFLLELANLLHEQLSQSLFVQLAFTLEAHLYAFSSLLLRRVSHWLEEWVVQCLHHCYSLSWIEHNRPLQ